MGVYPGEGKGEELTPALTPMECIEVVGKPVTVSPVPVELENVSSVHCSKTHSHKYMYMYIHTQLSTMLCV